MSPAHMLSVYSTHDRCVRLSEHVGKLKEQHYVSQTAVSSDPLLVEARPQGELLSLWFPENLEMKGFKSEAL